jgi:hypothetical protein
VCVTRVLLEFSYFKIPLDKKNRIDLLTFSYDVIVKELRYVVKSPEIEWFSELSGSISVCTFGQRS